MSADAHSPSIPKAEFFDQKDTGSWPMILLVAAAVGILGSLIGLFVNKAQFAYSWLFAFFYFFTLCVGCLFWTLVHHATDAEWTVVVRRVLERVASLIPLMFLFFLPLLLCSDILWKWWSSVSFTEVNANADPLIAAKWPYLTHGFFLLRLVLFFFGLSMVALRMRKNSVSQDADGHPRYTIAMRRLSFIGIPVLGVSLTFGAIDWLMGLDYKWFSTMWGVYIFAGAAGSSMSMLVLIVTALRNKGYLKYVTIEHYHIMGKLMLAFCVFWAYIGFSQYMLIWYANIPEETSYFIRRNIESWNIWSTFLVLGRFFIPFPILLLQATKKNPKYLCIVGAWIMFMQLVDIYIIVMPMLHHEGFSLHILDLLALLAVGAPLAFLFLKGLSKDSLFPARDPRLPESLKLTN
jgi:hypothetical protein